MNNFFRILTIVLITVFVGTMTANAQAPKKAPAYKITNIKIVPFDEATGKFEDEIITGNERSFFNDLSISLFVTIEVSGQAGSFEVGRKIIITVTEGKKVKFQKTEQVGLIGEGGKYHVPVFLYSSMCEKVSISAKLIGQATPSSIKRSVMFVCGE